MAKAQIKVKAETAGDVPVLGGVVPYLTVSPAADASLFYQRAFAAEEMFRHPLDANGRTMHIHLHLHGGSLMLSDAFPEYGHPQKTPQSFMLHLKVEGIDRWWQRAVDAGCEIVTPLQVMFWGDRYGQLRDPFGVMWSMGEPQGA